MHQFLIDVHPFLPSPAVHDLHGYLLELLLILRLCHLRLDLLAVDVLLQCQQDLVGIHGLDQIVGNLLADSLVHDVLFLTLGHHHHGQGRVLFFDALKGLQSAETGHLLVEQYQVEVSLPAEVDGVGTVAHSHHVIALALQEQPLCP